MARKRSGADLIDDALKRADADGYETRHPRADVLRYVNQGKAALRDLIIGARGQLYFRSSTPWTFTTTKNTILYTSGFPTTFFQLISVRVDKSGCSPVGLELASPLLIPELVDKRNCACYPTHYDLRPNGIEIYPRHNAGLTVTVEWMPASDDLTDTSSSYADGVDGWEDFIVAYAAKKIAEKDDDPRVEASCEREMQMLASRIAALAPKRDRYRARRVQDARGARMFGRLRGGR